METKPRHLENSVAPEIQQQPKVLDVVPAPDRADQINSDIVDGDQKIERLTVSIGATKDGLRDVRDSLGLPQSEQDPPSVVQTKEVIDVVKRDGDVLRAEKDGIESGTNAVGNTVEAPQLAEGMDKDPRFSDIEKELRANWIRQNGDPFSNPQKMTDYGYFLDGSPLSPDSRAKNVFAARFPEDANLYAEKEKTRVYKSAYDDPAVRAVEKDIQEIVRVQIESDPDSKRDASQIRAPIASRAWSDFVNKYPEKAKAYGEKFDPIKHEFEGRERVRQIKAQQARFEQDRVVAAKEHEEIIAGWDEHYKSIGQTPLSQAGTQESPNVKQGIEKRYTVQRDEFVRERLDTLQNIVEDMRKGKPEVLSACLFGSSVHGRSRIDSDVDANVFIDVEAIGKEDKIKTSSDRGGEDLKPYSEEIQTKMKKILGLSDEQVEHIRTVPVSKKIIDRELEEFIKNAELMERYETASEQFKKDLELWLQNRKATLDTHPQSPKIPDTHTSSLLGSMFRLAVGVGIRPYRSYLLEKLKQRGGIGEKTWQTIVSRESIFNPKVPKTLDDALRVYSQN